MISQQQTGRHVPTKYLQMDMLNEQLYDILDQRMNLEKQPTSIPQTAVGQQHS